ncbi:hypothetical protein ES703_45904 [subsurface metagenome]
MSVINTKLFTVISGITNKPVTILVEAIKPLGEEPIVVLETLEGEYDSREEFEDALDYTVKGWEKGYAREGAKIKKWKLIYLKIPGAQKLVHVLKEVLEASEEG